MGYYIVLLLGAVYNLVLILYSQEHLCCDGGPYWTSIVLFAVVFVLYPLCEIIGLASEKKQKQD